MLWVLNNEYPQHRFLWREKENYTLIITKYPPYLFHCYALACLFCRLFLAARLMFALSLFISYGLQFYVPVSIIWPFIEKQVERKGHVPPWYSEYVFRFILVLITCKYMTNVFVLS